MFSRFFRRLSQITGVALFVELSRVPKINFFDTAQFAEFVRWPKMFDNVPFFSEIIPQGGGGEELPMRAYTGSRKGYLFLACLQAVTGGFIAEDPFRSVIGCRVGFSRRALTGTRGRAQTSKEGGGGGKRLYIPAPVPSLTLSTLYSA